MEAGRISQPFCISLGLNPIGFDLDEGQYQSSAFNVIFPGADSVLLLDSLAALSPSGGPIDKLPLDSLEALGAGSGAASDVSGFFDSTSFPPSLVAGLLEFTDWPKAPLLVVAPAVTTELESTAG